MTDDEVKRARRREQNRKHQAKYRERHPDKAKASRRKWNEANRENLRQYAIENREQVSARKREWARRNPEKVKAARDKWLAKNPHKKREYENRWRAKNPEKMREARRRYSRAFRERQRAIQRHWPAFGELRHGALMGNEAYAEAWKAVPRGVPPWARDEAVSEAVLAFYEGAIQLAGIGEAVRRALRAVNSALYRELSLDAPVAAGSKTTYLDLLEDTHGTVAY